MRLTNSVARFFFIKIENYELKTVGKKFFLKRQKLQANNFILFKKKVLKFNTNLYFYVTVNEKNSLENKLFIFPKTAVDYNQKHSGYEIRVIFSKSKNSHRVIQNNVSSTGQHTDQPTLVNPRID